MSKENRNITCTLNSVYGILVASVCIDGIIVVTFLHRNTNSCTPYVFLYVETKYTAMHKHLMQLIRILSAASS